MKRRHCVGIGVAAALAAVLGLALGPAAAQEAPVFKVGVVTSLSGEMNFGGNVTKRGYDLWADTTNAAGGIAIGGKRYRVQLVYGDDQSSPATAAIAAERLITQEKVDFVLGPYASGTTLAVAPITDKYKVPHITGSAESPLIWKQKFKYTFGTIPAVNQIAPASIKTLAKDVKPAPKTVAVVGIDDAFSKFAAQAFKDAAEQAGLKVVKFEIVPEGADYTPTITAVKAANPDVLAIGSHEKAAMEMIKAAKELGFVPKAIAQHYGMTTPDFLKGLGKDAEFIFGSSVWTAALKHKGNDPFGTPAKYAETFQKKYGTPPDYTEAACTAAGLAFEAALKQIGATPPLDEKEKDALVAALEKLNIRTFYGPIKFATEGDFYHDNVGLASIALQIQGGKIVEVGPGALKVVNPRYPMPEWTKR